MMSAVSIQWLIIITAEVNSHYIVDTCDLTCDSTSNKTLWAKAALIPTHYKKIYRYMLFQLRQRSLRVALHSFDKTELRLRSYWHGTAHGNILHENIRPIIYSYTTTVGICEPLFPFGIKYLNKETAVLVCSTKWQYNIKTNRWSPQLHIDNVKQFDCRKQTGVRQIIEDTYSTVISSKCDEQAKYKDLYCIQTAV